MTKDSTIDALKQRIIQLEKNDDKNKQVIKKLKGSEKSNYQILENTRDIIVTLDHDYRILYLNRTIFGIAIKKALGRNFLDLLSSDYQDILKKSIQQVIQSGLVDFLEYEDSKNSRYTIKIMPFHEDKITTQVMITLCEVSRRKQIESKLSQKNGINRALLNNEKFGDKQLQTQKMEAIGSLAAGIAHEFNNILWIINGNVELAMGTIPDGDPARYHLEQVEEVGMRAKDLVAQIISFTRQSKQYYEPLKIDLVIKEFLKLLRSSIPTTIKIKHHISAEYNTIMADLTQMNLLVLNVCSNAAHYMKDIGGILEVSLVNIDLDSDDAIFNKNLSPGKYVVLTILDTGPGIEPEVMDRMFDPFFTTNTNQSSTGMGLSVVNTIVNNHSGAITVHSELGKGTVFHIFLPCLENNESIVQNVETIPQSTGNERILFVDDEAAIVDASKRTLERLGYYVITATSGLDALKLFRDNAEEFDLVVTDMTMPELTGVDLAKEVFSIRPQTPMILCTGYSTLITPEKSKQLGFKDFLMKPVSKRKMAESVRHILDHSHP